MKIKLILIAFLTLGIATLSHGQASLLKMVGKKVEGPVVLKTGDSFNIGDHIELHEGLAPEGFRHVYTIAGNKPLPLGYGANYEIVTIDDIRHNAKYDEYYVFIKFNTVNYVVEVDKGLKSGEIKRIISKSE